MGFAIDFGGAYGGSDGDKYTESGFYIGARNPKVIHEKGNYAEIGAFTRLRIRGLR